MARSRKQAYIKDSSQAYRKHAKRQANKAVRRYKGTIPNGKAYKKLFCSYNIYDWQYDLRWDYEYASWDVTPTTHWRNDRYYRYT